MLTTCLPRYLGELWSSLISSHNKLKASTMAKKAASPKKSHRSPGSVAASGDSPRVPATACTASSLASDPFLGYKIRVVLYDLQNMPIDSSCDARIQSTTDVLYMSLPYFTLNEASKIKNAVVDHAIPSFTNEEDVDDDDFNEEETTAASNAHLTVEEIIQHQLGTFLDKRRASGDFAPCGPHTMAPLYRAVFGISKEDLADEKFLGRFRRCGLGEERGPKPNGASSPPPPKKNAKKGKRL